VIGSHDMCTCDVMGSDLREDRQLVAVTQLLQNETTWVVHCNVVRSRVSGSLAIDQSVLKLQLKRRIPRHYICQLVIKGHPSLSLSGLIYIV